MGWEKGKSPSNDSGRTTKTGRLKKETMELVTKKLVRPGKSHSVG